MWPHNRVDLEMRSFIHKTSKYTCAVIGTCRDHQVKKLYFTDNYDKNISDPFWILKSNAMWMEYNIISCYYVIMFC